jgi:hypothetical protein
MIDETEIERITAVAVLPGQIPAGRRLDADVSGERALMLAILEDAAWCIMRGRSRRRYAIRALAADAASWVEADDRAWPFSFVNICDVLGVDADALRVRLLKSESSCALGTPGAHGDRVVANGGLPPRRRQPSAAA